MLSLIQFSNAQWVQIGDIDSDYNEATYLPDLHYDHVNNRLLLLTTKGIGKAGIQSFDGAAWTELDTITSDGSKFRMNVDPATGFPWIIMANNSSAEVYFHNGSNWIQAGSGIGTSFPSQQMDLEFNPLTNQPYALIYSTSNLQVWTYDGSWNIVGSYLDNSINCTYLDLTFDPTTGEPVVSYNKVNSTDVTGHLKIKQFTNSTWSTLDDLSSGTGELITYNQLAYDNTGVLYLHYWSQDIGTQVKKYIGNSFIDATDGTGTGYVGFKVHMKLDPNSNLLWFAPAENSTMKQLDGNSYIDVSSDLVFTGASFTHPRMTFDKVNNVAYVAAAKNGGSQVIIKKYIQGVLNTFDNTLQSNKEWSIFPNPTNGGLSIDMQNGSQYLDLFLINNLGQTVQSWTFEDVENVHVSVEAEKGTYFLIAVTENGQSSKTLIVE
jgi:hypothetical protein